MSLIERLQQADEPGSRWLRDWLLGRYLKRRTLKRRATICRRRSDGTLWAASCPQNPGLALGGLFGGKPSFHFVRVREWKGIPIIAPRLFWSFNEWGQFDILGKDQQAFWLKPWAEPIETPMLTARAALSKDQPHD